MICIVIVVVIDTSLVKIYDLKDKRFISQDAKLILFSTNTIICLLLEFILIKYIRIKLKEHKLSKSLNLNLIYSISLLSLSVIGILMGLLIFQQFYDNYYKISISIAIINISYGTAIFFIIRLSILFLSWYKTNHNWILLLYFVSMLLISFNLLMTSTVTSIKLMDRPQEIRMFVGGTVDLSFGKYIILNDILKISSFLSFSSIWITTALVMKYYREKLMNTLLYWIVLAIPLVYFLINLEYMYIFGNLLNSYLTTDPVTVSIILTGFLSLSKPIGGLTFAIAFWRLSKIVSYEKNLKDYLVISGWGILLVFGMNQALVQSLAPYPPFGLVTITVLIIAGYLMLLGIYNSASRVSVNDNLRKFIYKQTSESNLLGLIGKAEKEKEIKKIIKNITTREEILKNIDPQIELDEVQVKKYIEYVTKELSKNNHIS